MNPLPLPLRGIAPRTTVRGAGSPAGGVEQLRLILARVVRTGRGPAGLVGWVRQELHDLPPTADDIGRLADRLAAQMFPPGGQTVGG